MFVLEALLLTFMTTPAVTFLYPPELRVRVAATGSNFANVPGEGVDRENIPSGSRRGRHVEESEKKERFLVVLDRLEHLPGMMALAQLIQSPPSYSESDSHPLSGDTTASDDDDSKRNMDSVDSLVLPRSNLSLSALRLVELTDRTSAIMKYSSFSAETLIHSDPLLAIFRAFLGLIGSTSSVGSEVRMVSYEDLAPTIKEEARRQGSQMVLLPWMPATQHIQLPNDTNNPNESETQAVPRPVINNPFEALFRVAAVGSNTSGVGTSASALHSHFIRNVFANNHVDVALYVDQEQQMQNDSSPLARSMSGGRHHIFLPFFGGPDDRLAIEFVAQICATNPRVSATVVRFIKKEDVQDDPTGKSDAAHLKDEQNRNLNTLTVASVC